MALSNAEKQQNYRDREVIKDAKGGCRTIKFKMYKGTQDDIAYLMEAGGFDDERELITIMLRNAAWGRLKIGIPKKILEL